MPPISRLDQIIPAGLDHQSLLRTVFVGHFAFTTLVLLGSWVPQAYQFYNGFLVATLVWAIVSQPMESDLALLATLGLNTFGFLVDIFIMASGWPPEEKPRGGWEGFALVMAIFHLILRVPSGLVVLRVRADRERLRYDNWEANQHDSEVSSVVGGSYNLGGRGVMPSHHYDTRGLGIEDSFEGDTKPIAP